MQTQTRMYARVTCKHTLTWTYIQIHGQPNTDVPW